MTAPSDDLSRSLRLARIALAFGRVDRATRHEDGVRPETDTDHTVMLGLVACELAPPSLDRAKVAAFALVHDLPEVYAGDTQTLVITPEVMAAKREREDAARVRLAGELGAGSWVADTLAVYERQQEPEARFVRAVDKVLPKLTHAFNRCAAAKALTDRAGFVDAHDRQHEKLSREYPELPDVLALLRASMEHAEALWPAEDTAHVPLVTAPDDATLAAIEALGADATPRPWMQAHHIDEPRAIVAVAEPALSLLGCDSDGMAIVFRAEDAALIVAAVNTHDALIAALRAERTAHAAAVAAARAEALREAAAHVRGLRYTAAWRECAADVAAALDALATGGGA